LLANAALEYVPTKFVTAFPKDLFVQITRSAQLDCHVVLTAFSPLRTVIYAHRVANFTLLTSNVFKKCALMVNVWVKLALSAHLGLTKGASLDFSALPTAR